MNHPICLGITGASGAVYAVRLLEVLRAVGREVHLSISPSGRDVIRQELEREVDLERFDIARLALARRLEGAEEPSPCPLPEGEGRVEVTEGEGRVEVTEGEGRVEITEREGRVKVPEGVGYVDTGDRQDMNGGVQYFHHQDFMAPMASGSFLTAGMVICPCSGSTLSAIAAGAASNLIQRAAEVHLKERRKLVLVPREAPLSLAHIDNMRRVTEAGAVVLPASPGWYHGVRTPADLVDFVVARICDQLGVEHALAKRWGQM